MEEKKKHLQSLVPAGCLLPCGCTASREKTVRNNGCFLLYRYSIYTAHPSSGAESKQSMVYVRSEAYLSTLIFMEYALDFAIFIPLTSAVVI